MEGADANREPGEGPLGGMLGVGSLRRSPTQAPERVSTWGAVLRSLNTGFFRGDRCQEGQMICFPDPSILNVNEDCSTEPVFPGCVPSLAAPAHSKLTAGRRA